jgi:hypothetical protein
MILFMTFLLSSVELVQRLPMRGVPNMRDLKAPIVGKGRFGVRFP